MEPLTFYPKVGLLRRPIRPGLISDPELCWLESAEDKRDWSHFDQKT